MTIIFLVSNTIAVRAKRVEIRPSIAPDHKAIFLSFEIQGEFKRGPGSWKFNNQLLEDQDYINLINTSYNKILDKYKDVRSKRLLWGMIKMEIRSKTIQYSKNKRLVLKRKEIELQEKIQKLDQQICNNQYFNQNLMNNYELTKKELRDMYDSKGKEAMSRSKVRREANKIFLKLGEKELR